MPKQPTDAMKRKYRSVFEVSMDGAAAWNATLATFGHEYMKDLDFVTSFNDVEDEVYEDLGLVTNARWNEWLQNAADDARDYGVASAVNLWTEQPDVDIEEDPFGDYMTPDYVQDEARSLGESFAEGKPDAEDVAGWAETEYIDSWNDAMFGAFYEKMERLQA